MEADRMPVSRIHLTLRTLALIQAASGMARAVECRDAMLTAPAAFGATRATALAACEKKVSAGRLPAGTDCATEPSTAVALTRAAATLAKAIAGACGGGDRMCGTADDPSLSSIGWLQPTCPGLGSAGCTAPVAHCGDIAACLTCVATAATDAARTTGAASGLSPSADAVHRRCQQAMSQAAAKRYADAAKRLRQCGQRVLDGSIAGPCPHGDPATAARLAAGRTKLVSKICKACGGGDQRCDGTAAGVPGSAATDDLLPHTIDLPAHCPHAVAPSGGASCGAPIESVSDAVTCLDCTITHQAECVAAAGTPAATYPSTCSTLRFAATFDGPDGSAWPAPWTAIGGVALADRQGDRGRYRPIVSGYSLARLHAPLPLRDVDARFTFQFTDEATQGVGFYVRSNGGYLNHTSPTGQGYAVFVEKFRPDGSETANVGLWIEIDGEEIPLEIAYGAVSITAGVRYRVRLRVHQSSPTETTLRAKMWPEADLEPTEWQVSTVDGFAPLQGTSGGIAFDAWSDITPWTPGAPQPSDVFVDDLEVRTLENPLDGLGAPVVVQNGFQFLEGPVWRPDGTLLFTDLAADTIYRLTPPATVAVFRAPALVANGLANDIDGTLLAAEHGARRVSRTTDGGAVIPVADAYLGAAFNSPNDLIVRSDGTIYFTDPRYGNPPPSAVGFAGLFRVTPAGAVVPEWQGNYFTDGPNGVALSPDERTLYLANTDAGTIVAYDVAPDGGLTGARVFASGLPTPDGLCVDSVGTVYVATWGNAVYLFAPDGNRWGALSVGGPATNCAFGGPDRRTLYVTTHQALYRVATAIPGLR
jgi:gluconolactonase